MRGKGTKLGEGNSGFSLFSGFGIFTQICGPIQDFYVRDYYVREYYIREKFVAPSVLLQKKILLSIS